MALRRVLPFSLQKIETALDFHGNFPATESAAPRRCQLDSQWVAIDQAAYIVDGAPVVRVERHIGLQPLRAGDEELRGARRGGRVRRVR